MIKKSKKTTSTDYKVKKSERDIVVTRGYLVDLLDSRDYVTKSYLEDVLDSRDYVNKEYLQDFGTQLIEQINVVLENQLYDLRGALGDTVTRFDNHEGRIIKLERKIN